MTVSKDRNSSVFHFVGFIIAWLLQAPTIGDEWFCRYNQGTVTGTITGRLTSFTGEWWRVTQTHATCSNLIWRDLADEQHGCVSLSANRNVDAIRCYSLRIWPWHHDVLLQFMQLVDVLKTMLNQIEHQRRQKMITELPDAETLLRRRRYIARHILILAWLRYRNYRKRTAHQTPKILASLFRSSPNPSILKIWQ